MGFSGIATTIIMFIAVLMLATTVIVSLRNQVDDSQASMRAQAELLNNQIKTNIEITSTNYTAPILKLYVINNGKTMLKLDRIDVYVDDSFIPRNNSNRTIGLEASTDVKNPGFWDPNEIIKIEVDTTLEAGAHTVAVSTQYNVQDSELFSI